MLRLLELEEERGKSLAFLTIAPRHVITIHHEYLHDSDVEIPPKVFMKTSDDETSL